VAQPQRTTNVDPCRRLTAVAAALLIGISALAACGSGGHTTSGSTATTTAIPSQSAAPGAGVTATSIKIGVSLLDFACIESFTDSIRIGEQAVYQAFIDHINEGGGIQGRKLVPVFEKFCPIGTATILAACTKFTEDANVFAVIGTFYDPSGDAQTCVAGQHHRVLVTFGLTQAIIAKAPAGLEITPDATPERRVRILLELLAKRHTLTGRKVAVLGDTSIASTANSTIVPALTKMGVQVGTTGLLSVTGTDTTAAQAQLDSFIERWKTEHVDTVFMSGNAVSSPQFVTKLRRELPNILLLSDSTEALDYAQQLERAGTRPNPYQGLLAAQGQTTQEYADSANWKYCKDIYEETTHQHAPGPLEVIHYKGGKTLDTYGAINDACQLLSMFHDIAQRAGKDLNNSSWIDAVNTFGHIDNRGAGPYSSLSKGKYDANDNFRLEQLDSSLPPDGNFEPITPLEDVTGE